MSNRISNPFWVDVLKSFSLYCSKLEVKAEELLYYPIFYNPNILIGNKSFFFKSWFDAGIHCIGDIYKNGSFISVDELNKMYNLKINFINYIGVTRAIDTFLKKYCISCPTQHIIKPFLPLLLQLILKNES